MIVVLREFLQHAEKTIDELRARIRELEMIPEVGPEERELSKHLSALLRFKAALAADCGGTIRGLAAAGARERGRSDGADRPLEARTKEFNTCASSRAGKPACAMTACAMKVTAGIWST